MHQNHQTLIKNKADTAQVDGSIIRFSSNLQLLAFVFAWENRLLLVTSIRHRGNSNSNGYNCSIIVIDGTECSVIVIVIENEVTVTELLLCYYN